MSTPQDSGYGVPAYHLEEIFQKIIVPDYLLLANPQPQQQPEAVLLGGQPGAGKSTTAALLRRQYAGRGGLVTVTWDDFRPFHPDYERLLAEAPHAMPDATRAAARWWQDRSAAYLREARYHTLLEGGFRDPGEVLAGAAQFRAAGYEVHVSALAVPAALSRLGIVERYARQAEVTGRGRWTTQASHDADYTGTVTVLEMARESPAVSRVSLWTREGLIYDDQRGPGGDWTASITAADVLHRARSAPVSREQSAALVGRLDAAMDWLRRAGRAHQALHETAALIRQDLAGPAGLSAAGSQLRAERGDPDICLGI